MVDHPLKHEFATITPLQCHESDCWRQPQSWTGLQTPNQRIWTPDDQLAMRKFELNLVRVEAWLVWKNKRLTKLPIYHVVCTIDAKHSPSRQQQLGRLRADSPGHELRVRQRQIVTTRSNGSTCSPGHLDRICKRTTLRLRPKKRNLQSRDHCGVSLIGVLRPCSCIPSWLRFCLQTALAAVKLLATESEHRSSVPLGVRFGHSLVSGLTDLANGVRALRKTVNPDFLHEFRNLFVQFARGGDGFLDSPNHSCWAGWIKESTLASDRPGPPPLRWTPCIYPNPSIVPRDDAKPNGCALDSVRERRLDRSAQTICRSRFHQVQVNPCATVLDCLQPCG